MKISVYITSYNQKKFLTEAIESVLNQSLLPSQIIIVDDCSTDGSQKLISDYTYKYPNLITPIYHSKNTGISQVRIDALNAVTEDYVTYVDGDDRFMPKKLEKEAKALELNPDVAIAYSNNYYMTEHGKHFAMWIEDVKPPDGDVFLQTFSREFPKKSLFRMELVKFGLWKSIGFHDQSLKLYEDYDMRIRLTKELKTIYVNEPLSEIRHHNKGLSKQKLSKHFTAISKIYKKNIHLVSDFDNKDINWLKNNFECWIMNIIKKRDHYLHPKQITNSKHYQELLLCANLLKAIGTKQWINFSNEAIIEKILSTQKQYHKPNILKRIARFLRNYSKYISDFS